MTAIEFENGTICIDAGVVAEALRIDPEELRERLRTGTVTSRHERGGGVDSGRFRLTFFSESRRVRLTIDASGAILKRSAINFVDKPRPSVTARIDALLPGDERGK